MKIDYLKTNTAKISHPTPHLIPDCWAALITADSRSHVYCLYQAWWCCLVTGQWGRGGDDLDTYLDIYTFQIQTQNTRQRDRETEKLLLDGIPLTGGCCGLRTQRGSGTGQQIVCIVQVNIKRTICSSESVINSFEVLDCEKISPNFASEQWKWFSDTPFLMQWPYGDYLTDPDHVYYQLSTKMFYSCLHL